jgi:1,2-diacylglycerol 3-alpha-glucosyltransferase
VKIGIFTDTYVPDINGVVTIIEMMRRELRREGHEVFVFCPKHPDAVGRSKGIYRFPSVRFIFYQGYRVAIPNYFKTRHIIRELDIIHSHDPGPIGIFALYCAERNHIPHVHTYHDMYVDYRKHLPRVIRPTRDTVKWISRRFCNRCNAIIAPSNQMKHELVSYGITSPIYPLSFGSDETEFAHEIRWDARQSLNLPTEDLLLYAGRLVREKNLDFLLRAFGRLRVKRPTAHLILTGDGPYREHLEEYASQLKLDKYITFTGFIPREKLIDLFKQTQFVFASKTDTQGLVLMEAMMAGSAPVAVNIMGPVDIIQSGQTGYLVNEDETEFADACLKLLENPDRRARMGMAARQWSVENSARASTQRLLEIYRCYTNANPRLKSSQPTGDD